MFTCMLYCTRWYYTIFPLRIYLTCLMRTTVISRQCTLLFCVHIHWQHDSKMYKIPICTFINIKFPVPWVLSNDQSLRHIQIYSCRSRTLELLLCCTICENKMDRAYGLQESFISIKHLVLSVLTLFSAYSCVKMGNLVFKYTVWQCNKNSRRNIYKNYR